MTVADADVEAPIVEAPVVEPEDVLVASSVADADVEAPVVEPEDVLVVVEVQHCVAML